MGWAASRCFEDRLSAISRKTWFPVSAQEWADSAIIEAEPVTKAATVFATATRRFAAKAKITVTRDEEEGIVNRLAWPMKLTVPRVVSGECGRCVRRCHRRRY